MQFMQKSPASGYYEMLLPSPLPGANPNNMQKILRFLLITVTTLATCSTFAAPVAQPGDVGLRHDIQVLADYGAISGPVTTWPISWDAVLQDLERIKADDVVLPNAVVPTFERVLARARREAPRGQHSLTGRVSAAEKPAQIRGFSDRPESAVRFGPGTPGSAST